MVPELSSPSLAMLHSRPSELHHNNTNTETLNVHLRKFKEGASMWCGYLRLELGVEQSARDRGFLFHAFLERRPLKSETVSTLAPGFSGTFPEGLGGGRMHEVGPRIHLQRGLGDTSVGINWATLLLATLCASSIRIVLYKCALTST
jgi:hypothetical protein